MKNKQQTFNSNESKHPLASRTGNRNPAETGPRLRSGLAGAVLALAGLCSTATLHATSISYSDFSSTAGLTLNGSASMAGNDLGLTASAPAQAGSAFTTTPVQLGSQNSFSTRFQFQIFGNGGGSDLDGPGADGFVFVLQTEGANSLGGNGSWMGYSGADPITPSLGIAFDTYAGPGVAGNHIAVLVNGSLAPLEQAAVSPRLNDGNVWTAWVDYNGLTDTLEVRANQSGIRPVLPTLTESVDLSAILNSGSAFAGFTAGTGGFYSEHRVLNWDFTSVPEGGSALGLLALGSMTLGAFRARWKRG